MNDKHFKTHMQHLRFKFKAASSYKGVDRIAVVFLVVIFLKKQNSNLNVFFKARVQADQSTLL